VRKVADIDWAAPRDDRSTLDIRRLVPAWHRLDGGGAITHLRWMTDPSSAVAPAPEPEATDAAPPVVPTPLPVPKIPEIGGPKGPEPTRYGDWEQKGRCTDF